MKQILVYGDSLSWGIVPGTRKRFPFHQRWPGVLESALIGGGIAVRVIENCLNGRRTAFDDPAKPGRNGLEGLPQVIELNSPLSLMLVLLGTNDLQTAHRQDVADTAHGLTTMIDAIRSAPIEPGMDHPKVVLMSPPKLRKSEDPIWQKFLGADEVTTELTDTIREVANETSSVFFDCSSVTESSTVDGVHLDLPQHAALGTAIAELITPLLQD